MFNRKTLNSFQFNPEMTITGKGTTEGALTTVTAKALLKLFTNSSVQVSLIQEAKSSLVMLSSGSALVKGETNATPISLIDGAGSTAKIECAAETSASVLRMIGQTKSQVHAVTSAEPFLFSWKEEVEQQDIWNETIEEKDIWSHVLEDEKDWRMKNA
jgi:hypothetical protein